MSKENALVNFEEQLRQEAANIKETLSKPSSNKISTRGKLFTLPDGTTSPGPMECIILDYISFNSYYDGVYDQNNPKPPVCWSVNRVIDDMQPSEACPNKQAESCAACPQNQFGSAGKGKACKNIRRLIVVPVNATEKTEPMTLEVSPAAIRAFDAYVLQVQQEFQTLPVRVITTVGFDANKTYPSLTFSDPRPHDNLEVAMKLRARAQEVLTKEPDAPA